METLAKINKVNKMENIETLPERYNDIENGIRNLESLKIESSTYGYLLIPLLKEKIPDELNMIISRKLSGKVWRLELMLNILTKSYRRRKFVFFLKVHQLRKIK